MHTSGPRVAVTVPTAHNQYSQLAIRRTAHDNQHPHSTLPIAHNQYPQPTTSTRSSQSTLTAQTPRMDKLSRAIGVAIVVIALAEQGSVARAAPLMSTRVPSTCFAPPVWRNALSAFAVERPVASLLQPRPRRLRLVFLETFYLLQLDSLDVDLDTPKIRCEVLNSKTRVK